MNKNNYVAIMAGGIGSRFWPMSRTEYPKQFLDILNTGRTLIQSTYDRFAAIIPKDNIIEDTSDSYEHIVQQQLPELNPANILCEPSRKNTAHCIAYISYKLHQLNPHANLICAPADHLILDNEAFVQVCADALHFTSHIKALLTLGIKPTNPNTGYGYIQFEPFPVSDNVFKVKTFTEKPELEMAKFFLQSGDFLWNSGIFVWSVNSVIKAFEKHAPELDVLFKEGNDKYNTPAEKEFIEKIYTNCKNVSIDIAVMEKAENVYVRSSIIGWSDLGTWGSLYEHIPHDENQNAIVGKNAMLYDSKNCIINVPKDKLVVLQGLEDYIVVESDSILLICKKEDEQHIRTFVNDVKVTKGEKFV